MGNGWSGARVSQLRKYWGARLPLPCYHCGDPVLPTQRWDIEHKTPRSSGGALWDIRNQWVSHAACNRADGATITNQAKKRIRKW